MSLKRLFRNTGSKAFIYNKTGISPVFATALLLGIFVLFIGTVSLVAIPGIVSREEFSLSKNMESSVIDLRKLLIDMKNSCRLDLPNDTKKINGSAGYSEHTKDPECDIFTWTPAYLADRPNLYGIISSSIQITDSSQYYIRSVKTPVYVQVYGISLPAKNESYNTQMMIPVEKSIVFYANPSVYPDQLYVLDGFLAGALYQYDGTVRLTHPIVFSQTKTVQKKHEDVDSFKEYLCLNISGFLMEMNPDFISVSENTQATVRIAGIQKSSFLAKKAVVHFPKTGYQALSPSESYLKEKKLKNFTVEEYNTHNTSNDTVSSYLIYASSSRQTDMPHEQDDFLIDLTVLRVEICF